MLMKFEVGNFLSFNENQTFSMLCGASDIHPGHHRARNGADLLRLAAMYGANASGKSNFIKALQSMRSLVVDNEPIVSDRYHRPIPENRGKPSLFDIEVEIEGQMYSYGFEYLISEQKVIDEWLYEIFPDKDSVPIFQRTGDTITHSFNGSDKDRMDIYAEDAADHPQRLFLNVMISRTRAKDGELKVFGKLSDWFNNKLIIMDSSVPFLPTRYLDDEYFERLNRLMSSFGTGINEMGYETKAGMEEILPQELVDKMKKTLTATKNITVPLRSSRTYGTFSDYRISLSDDGSLVFDEIVFRHNNSRITFHSDDESDGTKKLFALIANLYIDEDDVTFIMDELDARLHPGLTYRLIKMFLDMKDSSKQLIFTTHESCLMDFGLVRRDEIWFSEKDSEGASHLYSLEEFNERNDRRIEKAYREGRYGGVPVFSTVFPYDEDDR